MIILLSPAFLSIFKDRRQVELTTRYGLLGSPSSGQLSKSIEEVSLTCFFIGLFFFLAFPFFLKLLNVHYKSKDKRRLRQEYGLHWIKEESRVMWETAGVGWKEAGCSMKQECRRRGRGRYHDLLFSENWILPILVGLPSWIIYIWSLGQQHCQ